MTNDITDTKLIALISEGNELAFKELYDWYVEKMFLYAVNVLNDKEICEDSCSKYIYFYLDKAGGE